MRSSSSRRKRKIYLKQPSRLTNRGLWTWLVNVKKYICQAQSLNLFFAPDVNVRRLNNIHKRAWEKGLKTLYYCRSEAIKRAENISVKVERKVREDSIEDEESCAMCQA